MKSKVTSYEIKNNRNRTKSKNPKANNVKLNIKGRGGIKDNRKYVNDTTLSEAEKLSRRMALENMKRKGGNVRSHNKNKLFSKDFGNNDDTWDEDPFLLKAKQIDELDEGLDESSEEEAVEEDTEKYFSKGQADKKKHKTLEEKIRDSKIEKFEKSKANEQDLEAVSELNEAYRNEIRFILPKLGKIAKAQSTKDYRTDKDNYGDMFQKNFEKLIYAQRPQKADSKSLKVPGKENDKMVNMKIKRLREHLIKDGITKEDDNDSDIVDNDMNDEVSDSNESNENESDEDQEDSEEDEDIEEDNEDIEEDNEGDEESENDSDPDLDDSHSDASEQSDNLPDVNSEEAIKNLRKMIGNKPMKRKLDDSNEEISSKKPKLDNSKNEIDCLRVLLKMTDLRNDALFVMANEIGTADISEKHIVRKLVLATLFQDCLKADKPNSYSPELLGFIKLVMENASVESLSWLSVKSSLTHLTKDSLLDICSNNCDDLDKLALSTIFHVSNMLLSVLDCNHSLLNKHSLFLPFLDIIGKCPTQFYPSWLMDKLNEIVTTIEPIRLETVPVLSLKREFKIIQLLEPELNSKLDPAKDITKNLKEKVKKETRATKKALKLRANEKRRSQLVEEKKQSVMRKKKTMEIIKGLSNT